MNRQELLIVDDEPLVRDLVQTVVEDAGYQAVSVASGHEALAALDVHRYDLVVADLRMPEIDGIELLSALKKKAEQRASPPIGVLFLTGCQDIGTAVRAMQMGALDYVLKPFESAQLIAAVNTALDRSRELKKRWQQEQQSAVAIRKADLIEQAKRVPSIHGEKGPELNEPSQDRLNRPVANFEIPIKIKFVDSGASVDAGICRVNAGFLVIASTVSAERGERLQVYYRRRCIEAEVTYCKPEPDGTFRLGLAMQSGEDEPFRKEKRIPVHLPVMITVAGQKLPVTATVVDISPYGIGLTSKSPIEVGEIACVDLGTGLAFGEIRHCEKRGEDFRLGMQIEEFLLCSPADRKPLPKYLEAARTMLGGRR